MTREIVEAGHFHPLVAHEFYNFIYHHFNDVRLAAYIFDVFSIDPAPVAGSGIPAETFCKMLHYLQEMAHDPLVSFNAGAYLCEKRLYSVNHLSGIRFSTQKTLSVIDRFCNKFFPPYTFKVIKRGKRFIELSCIPDNSTPAPGYFFAEYLKGFLSAVPVYHRLPRARVHIKSYPFSIEDFLQDHQIPFQKKEGVYYAFDKAVAEDVTVSKKGADIDAERCEKMTDNLYLRNAFIPKGAYCDPHLLKYSVRWAPALRPREITMGVLTLLGLVPLLSLYHYKIIEGHYFLLIFVLYQFILYTVFLGLTKKYYARLSRSIEEDLLNELAEQYRVTGDAVTDSAGRIYSIQNIMEISQKILHEKDIVTLFDNIRKLTARALNADRATVFIHDSASHELSSGPGLSEETQEFKIPDDRGIAGEIFKLGKIINVKDAYNHPGFNKAIDRQTGFKTTTILGGPLLDLEGKSIGVIQVLNKHDGLFQKIDEEILKTLSTYIAIALKDSITIRGLQQKGLDPEIIEGLGRVSKFLYTEFKGLEELISGTDKLPREELNEWITGLSPLIRKLRFLFSDNDYGEDVSLTVADILSSISEAVQQPARIKDITISLESSLPRSQGIRFNADLFRMLIDEIISNALDAVDADGYLRVRIHRFIRVQSSVAHELSLISLISDFNRGAEEDDAGFIRFIKSKRPFLEDELAKIMDNMDEYLSIDVYNSGKVPGERVKDKMFYPFFSTGEGFGLGLAIARRAVERMGGEIEKPVGHENGTMLRVLIPQASAAEGGGAVG